MIPNIARIAIQLLAAAALLLTFPAPASAVTQTFEVILTGSENDAEEDSAGVVNLTEATLDMGGLYRKVGLRFANITLQKNAPITRAYIEFTTAGQDSGSTTFSIEAVAQDNPGGFTTGIFNISTRPVYSQAVDWVMNYAWLTTDEVHQSADITALVQKLVARSGWAPGNAMAFVISSGEDVFRKAKSWNADPAKAPKLHIEYAVNVVDVRVSAATDDIHQGSLSPYAITNGDSVVLSGSYVYSGFRFQNVNIPQGAVINYACLKFVAKANYAATSGYMRLVGEKRLNAPTFSTTASSNDSVYKRTTGTTAVPKTTYVQWSNNSAWTAGTEYTSADIKNIIQEIVGQAGWDTSTKSLALDFYYSSPSVNSQQRQVWSYNGDPAKAPLLHIEYGQNPAGAGTDPPVISLSNTELGRSTFEGSTAASQHFSLMNSGATALNYATTVTYNRGAGWLSLSPSAAGGTLGGGEEQYFTVNFDTTGLIAGTYDAVIKFTDANAANSPREVRVSLAVMPQGKVQCGDIPLYTQNIASPAVMVLLDLSGSMLWEIDLVKETDVLPVTPDLSPVVQEIVNRDGWVPGSDKAITFIIDKVSGSGFRYARSFDGYNPSAALLHIEYNDGNGGKTIETRIKKATDDGECANAIPFSTSTQKLTIGGCGVALRFEGLTIPKNSTITNARLQFVPYQTLDVPITVKVSAHASDNSPTFSEAVTPQLMVSQRPRTTANVIWAVEPWTGVTIETKIDVAKTVIGELVKDTGISWGLGSWANDSTDRYTSLIDYTKIHAGCNAHTAEHQAKLQAAVADLKTYSSTPYAPSMDAGRKYFSKEKKEWDPILNAETGTLFQEASCQPKFLIELSDGMGNVPSTTDTGLYNEAYSTWYKNLVVAKANALADAGVSTIGVGFGIPEGEIEQIYALAEVANTRGKDATSDSLYPMHQEDPATGKGLPYLATNKDQLMNVFRTIMNSVKGAVFFGSAPAATTSTDLGDMVVLASFNAGNWTGDIEAITKDANGKWNASLWKASENMPANRSVWTVDASNNAITYTGSTLPGDNYLCKSIGDIIHSTPMVVGAPPYFYAFDNYSSFKRNLSVTNPREKTAYVGSNDGLLHAFSLETGQERWAFLPKALQVKLSEAANGASYDPCSASYCHRYLLDGSPQVADVYGVYGGTSKWRTMLVVGQRGGGTSYTALDVTSGESFGAGSDPARFLWELTDADLGESWSEAAIERVSYPGGGTGATAWGVFVSSGYHENDNLQYTKEAYLYGVEANSGNGLWSDGTNTLNKIKLISESGTLNYTGNTTGHFMAGEIVRGATSGAYAVMDACISSGTFGQMFLSSVQGTFVNGEALIGSLGHTAVANGTLTVVAAAQKNNALSSPVTGNFGAQDHTEDCIYLGDLYGTMYRVDSIGKGQTPSVSKLFKFNPYPLGPDERPIRGKASIAYNNTNDGLWVYYGTGRYETAADKVNNQQQYFFGLKDAQTPRGTPYSLADLATLEARFTTATIDGKAVTVRTISGTNASAGPWAMKLFAGQSGWGGPATVGGSERMFTKPLVVGGIVFFTTFVPDADICTGSGDTWVFALDYKTGLPTTKPVFDLNGDGKFTDADKIDVNGQKIVPVGLYVGRGQGSAPVLFKDTLFITTSTPQYQLSGAAGSGNAAGLNALLVNIPQKKIRLESWKHD